MAYLDAWLEDVPDDAAGITKALGGIARAKGMTQVARDAGLSRESLYRALGAAGDPSFAMVLKVARALGPRLHAEAASIRPLDEPRAASSRRLLPQAISPQAVAKLSHPRNRR